MKWFKRLEHSFTHFFFHCVSLFQTEIWLLMHQIISKCRTNLKMVTINLNGSTLNIPRTVKIDWTINLLKVFLNGSEVLIRRFKLAVDNRLVCVSLYIQLGVNFPSFPITRNLIEIITMDYNLVFISRQIWLAKGVDTSMESSFEKIFAVCIMLSIKINVVLEDSIVSVKGFFTLKGRLHIA